MDKRNGKQKIAIIGPYPPPYGGISVHIQRVLSYLDHRRCGYDFYLENRVNNNAIVCYKFYGVNKLISLFRLLFKDYVLIHHHSPDWKTRVVLSIHGVLGKTVYLHIHGASLKDTIQNGGVKSFLTYKLLKFVNIIADNKDIAQLAQKYSPKSLTIIDAFLPPLYNEEVYKDFIAKYGGMLKDRSYVTSMVGWFAYYEGVDLYGFDIALDVLHRFKKEVDKNVLFLASINGVRSEELHQKVKNYIAKNNLNNNILFIYEDLPEIWPIYIVSNVFIRPTFTDGSALSVKEAMWFETPVIASDCVPRPKGVILFKNRSRDELFKRIMQVYNSNKVNDFENKINKVKDKNLQYKLFNDIYQIQSTQGNK